MIIENPALMRRRVSQTSADQIIDLKRRVADLEASLTEVINAMNASAPKAKKGTDNAKSSSASA